MTEIIADVGVVGFVVVVLGTLSALVAFFWWVFRARPITIDWSEVLRVFRDGVREHATADAPERASSGKVDDLLGSFAPFTSFTTPTRSPVRPTFDALQWVFARAFTQANSGKGRERHGGDSELHEQPWFAIARAEGRGFLTGQAMKKIVESKRLEGDARSREMLGAIVYLALCVLLDEGEGES
ncbi:MAG: hypothetical protein ACF8XB_12580 [Planctomycetota bacterium JB042]